MPTSTDQNKLDELRHLIEESIAELGGYTSEQIQSDLDEFHAAWPTRKPKPDPDTPDDPNGPDPEAQGRLL